MSAFAAVCLLCIAGASVTVSANSTDAATIAYAPVTPSIQIKECQSQDSSQKCEYDIGSKDNFALNCELTSTSGQIKLYWKSSESFGNATFGYQGNGDGTNDITASIRINTDELSGNAEFVCNAEGDSIDGTVQTSIYVPHVAAATESSSSVLLIVVAVFAILFVLVLLILLCVLWKGRKTLCSGEDAICGLECGQAKGSQNDSKERLKDDHASPRHGAGTPESHPLIAVDVQTAGDNGDAKQKGVEEERLRQAQDEREAELERHRQEQLKREEEEQRKKAEEEQKIRAEEERVKAEEDAKRQAEEKQVTEEKKLAKTLAREAEKRLERERLRQEEQKRLKLEEERRKEEEAKRVEAERLEAERLRREAELEAERLRQEAELEAQRKKEEEEREAKRREEEKKQEVSKVPQDGPEPITRAEVTLNQAHDESKENTVIDANLTSQDGVHSDRQDGKEKSNLDLVLDQQEQNEEQKDVDEVTKDKIEPSKDVADKPLSVNGLDGQAGVEQPEAPKEKEVPEEPVSSTANEPVLSAAVDTASDAVSPISAGASHIPKTSGDKAGSASKIPRKPQYQSPRYASHEHTGIPQLSGSKSPTGPPPSLKQPQTVNKPTVTTPEQVSPTKSSIPVMKTHGGPSPAAAADRQKTPSSEATKIPSPVTASPSAAKTPEEDGKASGGSKIPRLGSHIPRSTSHDHPTDLPIGGKKLESTTTLPIDKPLTSSVGITKPSPTTPDNPAQSKSRIPVKRDTPT